MSESSGIKNIVYVGCFRYFVCVFVFVDVFVIVFVFVFVFSDLWIAVLMSFQNLYGKVKGVCEAFVLLIIFEVMTTYIDSQSLQIHLKTRPILPDGPSERFGNA